MMNCRWSWTLAVLVVSWSCTGLAERLEKPADPERIARIAACLGPELKVRTPDMGRPSTAEEKRLTIERAEKALAEKPEAFPRDLYLEFTQTGNRTHFQAWRDRFLDRFHTLCGAELIEGKGRFSPGIAAEMDALAAWPSWTLPAHDKALSNFNGTRYYVDLFSAEICRFLAEYLVQLGSRLPTETVARIRAKMQERVFGPYLEVAERTNFTAKNWHFGNWWFFADNNWNPVCHSCCVRAALAAIPDAMTRAKFIEGAARALNAYFSGIAADGYCTEGMGYWNYGYGHFLMMGVAVREATGGKVDFFKHPRAKLTMRYPIAYQLQSGISPHFADGGGNAKSHLLRLGCRVWPDLEAEMKGALPLHSAFPDGQVWVSRLAADAPRPFSIAFKGGHNAEAHNHNDLGSWVIMLDGAVMAGDPGGEIYTARTFSTHRYDSDVLNSFGHPVPRVGGKLQSAGPEFAAKVVSTDFTEARDTVVLELAGGYEVPTLKSLRRTMTFDRASGAVTIADRVQFAKPTAFDDPIVTYGEFRADYAPESFAIESDAKRNLRLDGKVSVTGGKWSWSKVLVDNPQMCSPKRIAVVFDEPITSAEVIWTLAMRK